MIEVVLHQTCGACPEQYDMYVDSENIGYFRVRHGFYTVEYLGRLVFDSEIKGDGGFDSDERDYFLSKGIESVLEAHFGCRERFSYIVV